MFCHFNLLRNVFVYFAFWFAVIDFAIAYDIIDARNEFNNYLYDKSISYIQTEAGKGDAMAIGLLGKAYFEGRFFGKDYEKAYSLLNDGVNRGDLESYKSLGNLRLQKGKYNDPLEALRLFEAYQGVQAANLSALKADIAQGVADINAGRVREVSMSSIKERGRAILVSPKAV